MTRSQCCLIFFFSVEHAVLPFNISLYNCLAPNILQDIRWTMMFTDLNMSPGYKVLRHTEHHNHKLAILMILTLIIKHKCGSHSTLVVAEILNIIDSGTGLFYTWCQSIITTMTYCKSVPWEHSLVKILKWNIIIEKCIHKRSLVSANCWATVIVIWNTNFTLPNLFHMVTFIKTSCVSICLLFLTWISRWPWKRGVLYKYGGILCLSNSPLCFKSPLILNSWGWLETI